VLACAAANNDDEDEEEDEEERVEARSERACSSLTRDCMKSAGTSWGGASESGTLTFMLLMGPAPAFIITPPPPMPIID
jgi:hypothetical protein